MAADPLERLEALRYSRYASPSLSVFTRPFPHGEANNYLTPCDARDKRKREKQQRQQKNTRHGTPALLSILSDRAVRRSGVLPDARRCAKLAVPPLRLNAAPVSWRATGVVLVIPDCILVLDDHITAAYLDKL